jgi:Polyketide cyclase / dehydrase and lipid transport
MLIKILIVLVVIIVVLLIVAALRRADFRVERSIVVSVPPAAVFAQVNDFHKWGAWNPWAKLDPAMKETYDGAPSGVGASYSWRGNKNVGTGRMTLTESRPVEWLKIKLEFLKPFAATNTTEFTFKPNGNQTIVTWSMYGKSNLICRLMGLFMSMDKMVGTQFEKGLADLKAASEAAP